MDNPTHKLIVHHSSDHDVCQTGQGSQEDMMDRKNMLVAELLFNLGNAQRIGSDESVVDSVVGMRANGQVNFVVTWTVLPIDEGHYDD